MTTVSELFIHNCKSIRIVSNATCRSSTDVSIVASWYYVYADDVKVLTVFGEDKDMPPFVEIDAPSRLIISGKENTHA